MLRLAWLVLFAQSAASTNDHCSCHSVKSKTFTRLMYERGFRAAAAHHAPSNLELSPQPRRDVVKPALEELWRSLRAERRQVTTADGAARELARALNETGDWVLVYENRVYVSTEYYHAADHARHATMIREAAALVGLPNAIYVVNTGTRGPNGCNGRPVSLTINKQSGYVSNPFVIDQGGVRVPPWGADSRAPHARRTYSSETLLPLLRLRSRRREEPIQGTRRRPERRHPLGVGHPGLDALAAHRHVPI